MKETNNLNEVVDKIKGVENGIGGILVPLLKDTIQDYKKTSNKMFIIIIILIVILAGTIGYSLHLVYKQNVKYQEFLSQFEFGSEEQTYNQDLDTHKGGDIVNPNINVNNQE